MAARVLGRRALSHGRASIIIAEQRSTADRAHATLRLHAVDTGTSLLDAANAVVGGQRY